MRIRQATIEDTEALSALLTSANRVHDESSEDGASRLPDDYDVTQIAGMLADEEYEVFVAVEGDGDSEEIVGCAFNATVTDETGATKIEVRVYSADTGRWESADASAGLLDVVTAPAEKDGGGHAAHMAAPGDRGRPNPYEEADDSEVEYDEYEEAADDEEDDEASPTAALDDTEDGDGWADEGHADGEAYPEVPRTQSNDAVRAAARDAADDSFSPDSPSYYRRGRPPIPERPHKKRKAWTATFIALFIVLIVGLGILGGLILYQLAGGSGSQKNGSEVSESVEAVPADGLVGPEAAQATADGEVTGAQGDEAGSYVCEPRQINLMMIGDMLMHDEVVNAGYRYDGTYNYDFLFQEIVPWIGEADLKILNQETVMGDPSLGYRLYMGAAGPIMNTPTALADTEAAYGFNCILKATNHTLDLGYPGLAHELDYWGANYPNIAVVGVNNPEKVYTDDQSQNWVDNVLVLDFDGLKVGILNYTWATNETVDWETDHAVISYLSEDKIISDVAKAREMGAEFIVACPHWGIEYDTEPSYEEYYYSKLFCDLGVDVIFGAHPHVLQPVEVLTNAEGHQTVCFYSLSNYVCASIMVDNSFIGGIARATLTRNEQGGYAVTSASLIPTVTRYSYGEDLRPYPLAGYTDEMAAASQRPAVTPAYAYDFCSAVFGDNFDRDLGFVVLDLPQEGRRV